jgi:FAD/FMN-containing dehydrogenase
MIGDDACMTAIESRLIERLRAVVGDDGLDAGPEQRRFFAEDALRGRGAPAKDSALPLAVVRPATSAATAAVLAQCADSGVPVVAYGAGTGLMGGARSLRPGIVLDTVRLNSIEVHPADRVTWAGAGAILQDVDREMSRHGLCLGHDPWTYPVATVGGTLSTNSLGYRGGRYGGIATQALALEVALADGTLLRTRAVRRRSTGPDLARLFTGAEGTLGVITAAALESFPVPERRELRAYSFRRFEDGFAVIDAIAALGMRPSLLDYGEEHASPWPSLSSREEEAPLLYLGFEGFTQEVEASLDRAGTVLRGHGARRLSDKTASQFWDSRHVVAQRFARGRPREQRFGHADAAQDYIHVALPPSRVLEFRSICHERAAAEGVGWLECGLWTAPDFFSGVLLLPNALGGRDKLAAFSDSLLATAQDLGGSMEYVHGAGSRLAHLMEREHDSGLRLLRKVKATLDPAEILNPGKLGL